MRSRSRSVLAILAVATVGLGLATRRWPGVFGPFLAEHAGDALWAALVWLCFALLLPTRGTALLAGCAAATAVAVECSQLSDAEWIVWLRNLPGGRLVLGDGFDPWDFARYGVGITCVSVLDAVAGARGQSSSASSTERRKASPFQ